MKKIIYGILMLIVVITTVILIVKFNTEEEKEPKEEECYSITGGGYNIKFDTDSDIKIDIMHVCIACSPDSYSNLPIPERNGYIFDGWYYDSKFTKKVDATSTLYITPQPIYEKENCVRGYKDITLYAKWNLIDKKKN